MMQDPPLLALETLSVRHLDTYEKLDVVLFVGTHERPAALVDIAARTCMSVGDTKRTIAVLCAAGVLNAEAGGYVCRPADISIAAGIEALVRMYKADPLAVLATVSRAVTLRTSARHASRRCSRERVRELLLAQRRGSRV